MTENNGLPTEETIEEVTEVTTAETVAAPGEVTEQVQQEEEAEKKAVVINVSHPHIHAKALKDVVNSLVKVVKADNAFSVKFKLDVKGHIVLASETATVAEIGTFLTLVTKSIQKDAFVGFETSFEYIPLTEEEAAALTGEPEEA